MNTKQEKERGGERERDKIFRTLSYWQGPSGQGIRTQEGREEVSRGEGGWTLKAWEAVRT